MPPARADNPADRKTPGEVPPQHLRRQAMERIRQAVWQMRTVADLPVFLEVLRVQMRQIGLRYRALGVNIIDPETLATSQRFVVRSQSTDDETWELLVVPEAPIAGGPVPIAWKDNRVLYRPDLHVEDLYGERYWADRHPIQPVRCVVDIPFSHGTLALNSPTPYAFSDTDLQLVREVAGILSEGFRRLDDLRALERRAQEAEALALAISAVAGSLSLEQILEVVAHQAAALMSCPRSRVLLFDPPSGLLMHRAAVGFDWSLLSQVQVDPGKGWAGQAFVTGEGCAINSPADPGGPPRDPEVDALVAQAKLEASIPGNDRSACMPLKIDHDPVGVLAVGGRRRAFGADDLRLLERLGEQASLAIERTNHLAQLEQNAIAQRRLEAELRASEAKYRSLFAEMGQGFALNEILFDSAGTPVDYVTLEVNQAFEEILGTKRDSVVGHPASQFLPPEELKKWVDLFGKIVLEDSATHYEQTSPANQKCFHGYAYALNRSQFAVLFEDITDRKRAAEETHLNLGLQQVRNQILQMQEVADWEGVLRSLHRELSGLVDFWFCSIQFIDRQASTFTYYTTVFAPEDWHLQGQEQLPLPPSLKKVVETGEVLYRRTRAEVEGFEDQVKAEACSIIDVPFLGGTVAMNSTRENAFSDQDIQVLERFAQVASEGYQRLVDLKNLAQTRQQLQQAQKLEAVGQLTAGIAHNFNNLLQAVVANLSLAAMKGAPQVQIYLEEADTAAMRGAELVRQLMLYARGEAGDFSPQTLDLGIVVERAVSLCRKTIDYRFELQVDLPAGLPPVRAEAGQLEQVLLNLYINARDTLEEVERPRPWIRTTARLVERAAPIDTAVRPYVQLQVSDNGAGMDARTQERIFEPFFTTKEVGKGTGLGLATAYGILRRHGGWIECDSQVGVGTSFALYLPVAGPPAAALETAESLDLPGGTETLLLIDDEELVRRGTGELLTALGYRVLEAEDGLRGLELASQHRGQIALVLLDLSMPGLPGLEVLRRLRTQAPQLKVVIFTGYAPDPTQLDGAVEVIEKPFSIRKLAGAVRRILDSAL